MAGNVSRTYYVYWTVQHLDSWIKIDELDVTWFIISLFNAQHVSNVITSILRSLRLICWVISWVVLLWFDVCSCYVVVWLEWCGIPMQAEARTTYHQPVPLSRNQGTLTSWNPLGLSRPVTGLLYLLIFYAPFIMMQLFNINQINARFSN
jgi:hypothetical protein